MHVNKRPQLFAPDPAAAQAIAWLKERTGCGWTALVRSMLQSACRDHGATLDYHDNDPENYEIDSDREPGRPRIQGYFFPPKEEK